MFVVMLVETHLEDSSSPAWRRLAEFLYLRAGGLGLCCHHCHHCAVAVITTELTLRENLETQSQPKKIRKKLTKFWNLRPKNAVICPLKITQNFTITQTACASKYGNSSHSSPSSTALHPHNPLYPHNQASRWKKQWLMQWQALRAQGAWQETASMTFDYSWWLNLKIYEAGIHDDNLTILDLWDRHLWGGVLVLVVKRLGLCRCFVVWKVSVI